MRGHEETHTRRFLDLFEWIPVDDTVGERAGALARTYLRSHPGVDPVDHVIAATAQLFDARLLTVNRKHFPMFPDLADPYA